MRVKKKSLEDCMKQSTPNLIRILLVVMAISLVAVAILWTPQLVSYATEQTAMPEGVVPAVYALAAAVAVISLLAFLQAFVFPREMERGTLFGEASARALGRVSWLVLADCLLLAVGAAGLFAFGDRLLSPVFAFVLVIGLAVFGVLHSLAGYVREAAELREEAEATL